MLEKYNVCVVCGLKTPSSESSIMLYITSIYTSSLQELMMQGMQQNERSLVFYVKRTFGMSNLAIFYSLQRIWLSLLIGLNT